jgi:hypothetical protein
MAEGQLLADIVAKVPKAERLIFRQGTKQATIADQ